METTNKQTQTQKNLLLEQECKKVFEQVTKTNNYFICPLLNEKTKTKQIQRIKNFCNINFDLYELNIIFVGGFNLDYSTAIKLQVIE